MMDEPNEASRRELRDLPRLDLPPLQARALLISAQRRLRQGAREPGWFERLEPKLLLALGATHLVWALTQVLSR
jgi:hypothetical protein